MDLPVIDLDIFLSQPRESQEAANALITYGALVLHDSRVSEADNSTFLDLLEDYFAQPIEDLRKDERPELSYQIGVTLENTEKPKCAVDEPCLRVIAKLDPEERPLDITAHAPDPKCRFFWRMSEKAPYETQFPGLNASNVIPHAENIRDRWAPVMEQWGKSMKDAYVCLRIEPDARTDPVYRVSNLAEMAAVGLGIPAETFKDAGRYGPHLLAPTASDLVTYGAKDTILAGFHTDLNFLTIHGRSRYPGLHIWARNTGKRIPVKIPEGSYLLVQAGKQLEHITGGLIKAGFHEVVVNANTVTTAQTIETRKQQFPDRPLIRISSTFFWHLNSDFDLAPIPELASQARITREERVRAGIDDHEEYAVYETMKVGHHVQK
ncbi:hypothetical protein H0H93_004958 [Arthromyces matolae]|nr:hypothetical protein H0H93_004958 [Arthromyces matolae]